MQFTTPSQIDETPVSITEDKEELPSQLSPQMNETPVSVTERKEDIISSVSAEVNEAPVSVTENKEEVLFDSSSQIEDRQLSITEDKEQETSPTVTEPEYENLDDNPMKLLSALENAIPIDDEPILYTDEKVTSPDLDVPRTMKLLQALQEAIPMQEPENLPPTPPIGALVSSNDDKKLAVRNLDPPQPTLHHPPTPRPDSEDNIQVSPAVDNSAVNAFADVVDNIAPDEFVESETAVISEKDKPPSNTLSDFVSDNFQSAVDSITDFVPSVPAISSPEKKDEPANDLMSLASDAFQDAVDDVLESVVPQATTPSLNKDESLNPLVSLASDDIQDVADNVLDSVASNSDPNPSDKGGLVEPVGSFVSKAYQAAIDNVQESFTMQPENLVKDESRSPSEDPRTEVDAIDKTESSEQAALLPEKKIEPTNPIVALVSDTQQSITTSADSGEQSESPEPNRARTVGWADLVTNAEHTVQPGVSKLPKTSLTDSVISSFSMPKKIDDIVENTIPSSLEDMPAVERITERVSKPMGVAADVVDDVSKAISTNPVVATRNAMADMRKAKGPQERVRAIVEIADRHLDAGFGIVAAVVGVWGFILAILSLLNSKLMLAGGQVASVLGGSYILQKRKSGIATVLSRTREVVSTTQEDVTEKIPELIQAGLKQLFDVAASFIATVTTPLSFAIPTVVCSLLGVKSTWGIVIVNAVLVFISAPLLVASIAFYGRIKDWVVARVQTVVEVVIDRLDGEDDENTPLLAQNV